MTSPKNKPNGKSARGGNRTCRFRWLRHLGVRQEILTRADRARRPARVVITWEDRAEEAFARDGPRAIRPWAITGAWLHSARLPTGGDVPGQSSAARGS